MDRRVALILGNASYQQLSAIPPTKHDVADMSSALRFMGFTVTTRLNLRLNDLEQELERFRSGVRSGDLAMVYIYMVYIYMVYIYMVYIYMV